MVRLKFKPSKGAKQPSIGFQDKSMNNARQFLPFMTLISICFWLFLQSHSSTAQPRITNTPVPVVIPTTAPTEPPQAQGNTFVEASPSPTFTPTQPLPDARLVSVAASGTALIRDFPENGAVVGVLADNTEYQVLGQYFSWYQIQLPSAPENPAWVYFEDIRISGNLNEIPAVNPNVQPAQLSEQDIASVTAQVLLQTPSNAQTATAESRIIEIPEAELEQTGSTSEFAPTYTPPADIVQLRPTVPPNVAFTATPQLDVLDATFQTVRTGNIPPIFPILGLGLFGVLGLLVASIRR